MKRVPLLFLLTLLIAVAITACAPAAQVEAPAGEEVPAAEGQGEEDAAMEALIAEKAAGNHTLNFILNQDFTREEWEETLDRMIGYGAQISEEEKQQIIDWLVARND